MKLTTPTLWQIIGPDGPMGAPRDAYSVSQECSRLNDAANLDIPGVLREVLFRVEKAR